MALQAQPQSWAGLTDDKFRELLENLHAQSQQKQQPPPDGTQIANEATVNGLNAINAPQQPLPQPIQQQQRQPLNPQQYALLGNIVKEKKTYEGAGPFVRGFMPQGTSEQDLIAAADRIRNDAHARANKIRGYADAIGMDLNGYENVNAEEAAKKLAMTREQELADLLNPYGKYGETSEQYYNNTYMSLIGQGHSPGRAKRLAAAATKDYQQGRVSYLRNAFNTLGRDGNYVNDTGVGIIDQIAQEMPNVANVYAQAYKLPTAAQDRAEKLEDKALDQANEIAKLIETYNSNSKLQQEQASLTSERDDKLFEQKKQYLKLTDEVTFERFKATYKLNEEAAVKQFGQKIDSLFELGERLGFKGDNLRKFVAIGAGVNLPFTEDGKVNGKVSDDTRKNLKDMHGMLIDMRNSILTQMKNEAGELDYDGNPELAQKLRAVDAQLAEIESLGVAGITGVTPKTKSDWTPHITGNWNNDNGEILQLRAAMERRGFSIAQQRQALYEILTENGYTPEQAQQALGIEPEEVAKWQR